MVKVEELVNDGSVLKRQVVPGASTSKPDNFSQVFLSLEIKVDGKQIYSSGKFYREGGDYLDIRKIAQHDDVLGFYMDEYFCSKVLSKIITVMKKNEEAIIHIKNTNRITYGFDHEILKENKALESQDIDYYVKLYNFSEVSAAYMDKTVPPNLISLGQQCIYLFG